MCLCLTVAIATVCTNAFCVHETHTHLMRRTEKMAKKLAQLKSNIIIINYGFRWTTKNANWHIAWARGDGGQAVAFWLGSRSTCCNCGCVFSCEILWNSAKRRPNVQFLAHSVLSSIPRCRAPNFSNAKNVIETRKTEAIWIKYVLTGRTEPDEQRTLFSFCRAQPVASNVCSTSICLARIRNNV